MCNSCPHTSCSQHYTALPLPADPPPPCGPGHAWVDLSCQSRPGPGRCSPTLTQPGPTASSPTCAASSLCTAWSAPSPWTAPSLHRWRPPSRGCTARMTSDWRDPRATSVARGVGTWVGSWQPQHWGCSAPLPLPSTAGWRGIYLVVVCRQRWGCWAMGSWTSSASSLASLSRPSGR